MHAPRLKLNRAWNARAAASWKCTCHLRRLMSFIPRLRARIIHFASTAVKGAPKDGKPLSQGWRWREDDEVGTYRGSPSDYFST